MIQGVPPEAGWLRPGPRRVLAAHVLDKVVHTALPGRRVVDVHPLTDGFRNANFRLHLDSPPEHVVLRIYEHDATLCRKETDILKLIRYFVPTPEVIHAEPNGMNDIPPFVLLRYIEGITFRELKRGGDADSISQAAYAVGQTLASIGRMAFPKAGWLGPGPSVEAPLLKGRNPAPCFVDLCLDSVNVRERMEAELRAETSALVWSYAAHLASLDDESHLVHGDFGSRNLLVLRVADNWTVAGVLDWEFSVAGSPLADIGHFLRYECVSRPMVEPHFSNGYLQAGGTLRRNWNRLARVIDLIALCESLTHDSLHDEVVAELLELVRATVDDRDPQFR
jgi:aminoglycoside phosphotransferase (APT) family kinase protein